MMIKTTGLILLVLAALAVATWPIMARLSGTSLLFLMLGILLLLVASFKELRRRLR